MNAPKNIIEILFYYYFVDTDLSCDRWDTFILFADKKL